MKLLTKWMQWQVAGREEQKFHCDLLLAPGEYVEIHQITTGHSQLIGSRAMFTKAHLAASWEHRSTEFVEEK